MSKSEIQNNLTLNYMAFINLIASLSRADFEKSKNGKWSAGQQLLHIYLGIKALERVLRSLDTLKHSNFGQSNGDSRTYDAIVEQYLTRLATGKKSNPNFAPTLGTPFHPGQVSFNEKDILLNKLKGAINQLSENINKLSEPDLDDYYIPHPLLNSLTIREMMYFTIYHVQHHHRQIMPNLM